MGTVSVHQPFETLRRNDDHSKHHRCDAIGVKVREMMNLRLRLFEKGGEGSINGGIRTTAFPSNGSCRLLSRR